MTDEIISQIKRNLSGNPVLDRDYLVSQLDFYKDHENSYDISFIYTHIIIFSYFLCNKYVKF